MRTALLLAVVLAAPSASRAEPVIATTQATPPPAVERALPLPPPPRFTELLAVQLAQLASLSMKNDLLFFGYVDRPAGRITLVTLGGRSSAEAARRELDQFLAENLPILVGFAEQQHGVKLQPTDFVIRYVARGSRQDVVRWENGVYAAP